MVGESVAVGRDVDVVVGVAVSVGTGVWVWVGTAVAVAVAVWVEVGLLTAVRVGVGVRRGLLVGVAVRRGVGVRRLLTGEDSAELGASTAGVAACDGRMEGLVVAPIATSATKATQRSDRETGGMYASLLLATQASLGHSDASAPSGWQTCGIVIGTSSQRL